jgi:TPR repeat protein
MPHCVGRRLGSRDNDRANREIGLERSLGSHKDGLPLGEALYWMAEKLMWGYEDVELDPTEAFKLFRQSADLGFSDALIRIGQLQQQGRGTAHDPSAALKSYQAAVKSGNFVALAFLAKLLSHSSHLERADALWDRFFEKLEANHEYAFIVASRGELLHDYITTQLQLGFEPAHMEVLRRYRVEIASHYQQLLEHAPGDKLDRLCATMTWIEMNLGPWPI